MRRFLSILSLWTFLTHKENHRILLANAQPLDDVATVIASDDDLIIFSRALQITALDTSFLSSGGPFTVFAPNDQAFAQLDDKYFEPEWVAHLSEIVFQQLIEGPAVESEFLAEGLALQTVGGVDIVVSQISPTIQINQGITLLSPDIPAENGIVHITDGVILPPSARDSVMDIINVIPQVFSTFQELLTLVGLNEVLAGSGPYTVLAPWNEAFGALGEGTLAELRSDTDRLRELLEYHIVPGIYLQRSLEDETLPTLPTLQGGVISKSDAVGLVEFPDLLGNNGAMHVITGILPLPEDGGGGTPTETIPPTTEATGTTPEPPATETPDETPGDTLSPVDVPTVDPIFEVEDNTTDANTTVADIIIDSNFTLMVEALNMTDWLVVLRGPGPYTVFAVPNDGFGMFPMKFLEDPIWNSHLTNLMLFHIVPQVILSVNMTENTTFSSLRPTTLLEVTETDPLQINGINVTETDIEAENGVVHVLQELLLPPSATDTALDLITNFPQFSVLSRLLNATGLYYLFNGTGPITAIAPVDTAFADLGGEEAIQALIADPVALENILLFHVVPDLVEFLYIAEDFGIDRTTEQGSNVSFYVENDQRYIDDAAVLFPDLLVQNGILQVVNSVIFPPLQNTTEPPTAVDNVTTAAPTVPATNATNATTLAPTVLATNATNATTLAPTVAETNATNATTLAPTVAETNATNATTLAPTVAEINATTLAPTMAGTNATTQTPTVAELFTQAPSQDDAGEVLTGAPTAVGTNMTTTMPPGLPSLNQIIENNPDFATFNLIVDASGLKPLFEDDPGPFTIFLPNNDAFEAFTDELETDPSALAAVVFYHTITNNYTSSELASGEYSSAEGSILSVTVDGATIMVNQATVIQADILGSNGVIHVIDSVLVARDRETMAPTTTPAEGGTTAPSAPAVFESDAPSSVPTSLLAPTSLPTTASAISPTEAPSGSMVIPMTTAPTAEGDCVTIPGQQVCCPPGVTTGIFFFCRYL